ncbi:hypothetical protein SDC9_114181 [bioreactor metagenome]|uniref:Uncharacterized protein n=1 Tax=bioreactor metagenome TaxID=1076179 RepID=A0A645BP57_9ZZZZ
MREELLPVVTLELECRDIPNISADLVPQDGVLHLPAARGVIRHGETELMQEAEPLRALGAAGERYSAVSHAYLDRTGNMVEWHNPADRIEWEACFTEPGIYRIEAVTVSRVHGGSWKTGQKVELTIGDAIFATTLHGVPEENPGECYVRGSAEVGEIPLEAPMRRKISLRMLECPERSALTMALAELRLTRVTT